MAGGSFDKLIFDKKNQHKYNLMDKTTNNWIENKMYSSSFIKIISLQTYPANPDIYLLFTFLTEQSRFPKFG